MKRIKKITALGLTAALAFSAVVCGGSVAAAGDTGSDAAKETAAEKEKVVAATGGATKPYVFVDENNEPTGYDIEVLKAVFEKLPQYELDIEVTDIPSVFAGLQSGTYQIGVNNFSYNEERGKNYYYSYPYDKIGYVFVTKKGAEQITSFAQLAGKTCESGTGVSTSNAIEAWNEQNPDQTIELQYTEADMTVQLQHIEDGTTDFCIMDIAMFNAYQEEFNFDIQESPIPEDEAKRIADNLYAYYILPKDHEKLRDDINGALKELKEDGTLTELSEKWYGQDTAPEAERFEETIN